jgi:hypothetical protein
VIIRNGFAAAQLAPTVLRKKHPKEFNPLVFNGMDITVRATGHADLVEDKHGNWWAVLLAVRPQDNGKSLS